MKGKYLDTIYELWGVSYEVKLSFPLPGESPENVREGHAVTYMHHFEDGGLSFSLPRFILEALAELRIAFSRMSPNFFRYFLGTWILAREQGMKFGLAELKQLFTLERNFGFPGTMILSPRDGRTIIEGIPIKDDGWRGSYFVFEVNAASVGDFDFDRLPKEWTDDIGKVFLYISY